MTDWHGQDRRRQVPRDCPGWQECQDAMLRQARDMVEETRKRTVADQSTLERKIEAVAEQIREVREDTVQRHKENRGFHDAFECHLHRIQAELREARRMQGPWLRVIAHLMVFVVAWQVTGMTAFMDRVMRELSEPDVYRPAIAFALVSIGTLVLAWLGVRKPKEKDET